MKKIIKIMKQIPGALKKQITVLYMAYTHPGVQLYKKLFILLIFLYALSPIDLIPDFNPWVGLLDDFLLIPLLLLISITMIPYEIWKECRLRASRELAAGKISSLIGVTAVIVVWIIVLSFMWSKVPS